jgi:hypothetical protein
VVQTVTSSIVYSSGSNLFGSALGDRQTFTGSVNITGSLALAGNITSNGTAVVLGSGTSSYLPKFTGASTIGNSQIFDNGTTVFVNATTAPALGSPEFFVKMGTANTYEGILVASSTNNNVIAIAHTGTQGIITTNYGTSGANTPLAFGTNGAAQMTLDTSGNLGLGVTPSNAYGDSRTFEFGAGGILWAEQASSVYNSVQFGSNFYYNSVGDLKYKNSGVAASRYFQYQGSHIWNYAGVAPSAGAALTFTYAMTLDASGRLALGRTSADHRLDVQGNILVRNTLANASFYFAQEGDNSSTLYQYNNSTLKNVIASNGVSYITGGNVLIGTTTDAGYKLDVNGKGRFKIDGLSAFGLDILNNNGVRGAGFYNTGGNNVQLYFYNSASVEKIVLDGGTGAGEFASTVTTTGVKFPASQVASADANTLDDYEEGTWTPVIGGSGGQSGQSYSGQNGYYVKIGRQVTVTFRVVLSNKGTITGEAGIKNLPFTADTTISYGTGASFFEALATSWSSIFFVVNGNTTFASVDGLKTAGTTSTRATTSDIGNLTQFNGSFTYLTT